MKQMATRVPYLLGLKVLADRLPPEPAYPFDLPFLAGLDLTIREPVAFFVGENGTGKSTLIEAIAALCRLPVSGGGRNELADHHGPERESSLSKVLGRHFENSREMATFFERSFRLILRHCSMRVSSIRIFPKTETHIATTAADRYTRGRTARHFWPFCRIE